MEKRIMSLILCASMVLSMFVQFAPVVQAEEVTPTYIDPWENPQAYVGSIAIFNPGDEEPVGSYHIFGDPAQYNYETDCEKDENYLYNGYGTENIDDLLDDNIQLKIIGYYDHNITIDGEEIRYIWYKVEAVEGYELPAKMADKPYVLYMKESDFDWGFPAALKFDLIEQQPEATPTPTPTPEATATPQPTATPEATATPAPTATPVATPTPDVEPDDGTGTQPDAGENEGEGDQLPVAPELDPRYEVTLIDKMAMFTGATVTLTGEPVATSMSIAILDTVNLPAMFKISYQVTDKSLPGNPSWYIIENTSDWPSVSRWEFCYVTTEAVEFVDDAVADVVNRLLGATTVDQYEQIVDELMTEDSSLLESVPEKLLNALSKHYDNLVQAETRTYTATEVYYDGKRVPVSVTGLIPDGLTLSVVPVADADILSGGFDVKTAEDIALALDIKLLNPDSTEWQPKKGRQITVEMGVAELGYQDGRIFQLEHKHGEDIYKFDLFVVMGGKITVGVQGFSIFIVEDFDDFNTNNPGTNGELLYASGTEANPRAISLEVGQTVVYYCNNNAQNDSQNFNSNQFKSTWWVSDPDGAIYYEIYSSNAAGTYGVNGRWIRITALKETTTPILLHYLYTDDIPNQWSNGTPTITHQYYNLTINGPEATNSDLGGYRLYVKDTINTDGCISAVLVDGEGDEVILDGMTYSWERDDDAYIVPVAFRNNDKSVDICRDHGGIIEDRRTPVTYTVTAILPNGMEKEASYTVYYQSEIINAGFENPVAVDGTYTFFTNGWPNLFWKTTSPGTGINLTRDIEYARFNSDGEITGTDFFPSNAEGRQFAEINAEAFGALYQDIIAAPGEDIEWEFNHAKRNTENNGEALFVIMGPTQKAQEILSYDDIKLMLSGVTNQQRNTMNQNGSSIEITYNGAKYKLWYHNADTDTAHNTAGNAWKFLSGTYIVPDNQYRTRLFFVSDPTTVTDREYGNLIDSAKAGQYKSFLVEYYEESFDTTNTSNPKRTLYHFKNKDESGVRLIYSTEILDNFIYFETEQNDLLSTIYINGQNYPYNIRYKDNKPCLFIQKYPGDPKTLEHFEVTNTDYTPNDYSQYDIVMQVFFRDTVIAVQKWVDFPTVIEDGAEKQALTASEKQDLIDELLATGSRKGYEAHFQLDCTSTELHNDTNKIEGHFAERSLAITENDPAGWYTGYIPFGDNPGFEHVFTLEETQVSELAGLELESVTMTYNTFHKGEVTPKDTVVHPASAEHYTIGGIKISDNDEGGRLAEIQVRNKYKEKDVTFNYVAVGHGKVDLQSGGENFVQKATETFKYYSGKPVGARPKADTNYTFAGWYLDEACTIPVDENHGYVGANNEFVPNKAKTVTDDNRNITYYAKFSIGSLQIIRENAEPGQVFVYEITNKNDSKPLYVTVTIGEDGKGHTEIVGASFGANVNIGLDYTVKEIQDWSWRYGDVVKTQTHKQTTGLHGAVNMTTVFTFTEPENKLQWLSGNSPVKVNAYTQGGAG